MTSFLFGVWEGVPFDNRLRSDPRTPDIDLSNVGTFDENNPLTCLMSDKGFVMLSDKHSVVDALARYYERAKNLSCGRCTPCRSGVVVVSEALEKALEGKSTEVDWDHVKDVLELMKETSLCGIGLTSPIPLLGVLEHFPELLSVRYSGPMHSSRGFFAIATAPCIEACPSHVNIPRYIDYIRCGRADMATTELLSHYPLVGSCGRVCVRPCESACVRGQVDKPIAIKDLKRFAADQTGVPLESLFNNVPKVKDAARVAVIGAGPAGLNCAYHLLKNGYGVDVYDRHSEAGGMARLGIPAYRLPNELLKSETEIVSRLGGTWHFEKSLGRDFDINELFGKGYDAVFLGVGCCLGTTLGLPGENPEWKGYLKGLDFLLDLEKNQSEGKETVLEGDVMIVGCGNVAMDCARSARRLVKNGRVFVSYRRTQAEAPADQEEIEAAMDEGIEFMWNTAPKSLVVEDGQVKGIELDRMELIPNPNGGRSKLVVREGEAFVHPVTTVIAAIGQKLEQSIFSEADGVKLDRWGNIEVDSNFSTSREGVFAGGDAAAGPSTLIAGMADGQMAATSIIEYLKTKRPGFISRRRMDEVMDAFGLMKDVKADKDYCEESRAHMARLPADERVDNFEEVELGLTADEAFAEADRCLRCYRILAVTTEHPIQGNRDAEGV